MGRGLREKHQKRFNVQQAFDSATKYVSSLASSFNIGAFTGAQLKRKIRYRLPTHEVFWL